MQEEHGIEPTLEQADPGLSPSRDEVGTVADPESLRPASKLQERDPQTHAGAHPERPPFEVAADSDTMGLDHVRLALSDLVFPLDKDDLLRQAGRWRIPTTGRHFHLLADYLVDVDKERFRSADDVVRAIGSAHPDLKR